MAVYERRWRRYLDAHTPLGTRFLVVTRFALRGAFSSRVFTAFYAACFLPTLVALFLVYFSHNLGLLKSLGLTEEFMSGLTIGFFTHLFPWQAVPAFFVAVIVSPSLVAPDLSNNALPLYLSRPINRSDYVIGKALVLFILLTPVTWVAGLLVFVAQCYFEGGRWWLDNFRIGIAYTVGHLSWIVVISLLSLAISAWVRYKPVARGVLVGVFFILGGLGQAINGITGSDWGTMLNIGRAIVVVVIRLFNPTGAPGLPTWAAWASLLGTSAISLWMLWRRLRAHEVIQ